ncbi:MAG TPA: hypothetical protein DDW51_05655 [Cyanobacteria bacterium UBA11367]|nr:hypothetical protein [Cyanobacteria bacterium UBA11367]HBE56769.1 hypothetical protein [Cyanobacteria bacterium UBA11366]HCA95974.1 hypothetical protein [Cyanobacteria bacterium UBA9226]
MKILIYGENKERQIKWRSFIKSKYPEIQPISIDSLDLIIDAIAQHDVVMIIVNVDQNPSVLNDLREIKGVIRRIKSEAELVVVANPSDIELGQKLARLNISIKSQEDNSGIFRILDKAISKRSSGEGERIINFAERIATIEQLAKERGEKLTKLESDLLELAKAVYGGLGNQGIDDRIGRIETSFEHINSQWIEFEETLDKEMSKRIWKFIFLPAWETIIQNPTATFTAFTAIGAMGAFIMQFLK